jgi:succinate dehydrogenase/fumarate reductase-like Fe-S protein
MREKVKSVGGRYKCMYIYMCVSKCPSGGGMGCV